MFVQTQKTPNPDSLKFLPGRKVSNAGSFEVSKKDNFNNVLVKNILSINGVESIFLGSDFVSINKNKDIDWEDIKKVMRKPSWIFDSRSVIQPKDFINSDLNIWRIGDGSAL